MPSELAHLAVPIPEPERPDAAAAPPRARLSILAVLGFIAGAILFVKGAAAIAIMGWLKHGDWMLLEEMALRPDGRRGIVDLVFGDPIAVHAAVLYVGTIALVLSLLVGFFNLATLVSCGRKAGVRGRGYAFLGMLLAGVGVLGSLAAFDVLGKPAARWRQMSVQPIEHVYRAGASRLERLGAVSALARHGEEGRALLLRVASEDRSPAIRFAARAALEGDAARARSLEAPRPCPAPPEPAPAPEGSDRSGDGEGEIGEREVIR